MYILYASPATLYAVHELITFYLFEPHICFFNITVQKKIRISWTPEVQQQKPC